MYSAPPNILMSTAWHLVSPLTSHKPIWKRLTDIIQSIVNKIFKISSPASCFKTGTQTDSLPWLPNAANALSYYQEKSVYSCQRKLFWENDLLVVFLQKILKSCCHDLSFLKVRSDQECSNDATSKAVIRSCEWCIIIKLATLKPTDWTLLAFYLLFNYCYSRYQNELNSYVPLVQIFTSRTVMSNSRPKIIPILFVFPW